MNGLSAWAPRPTSIALGWALVHFVWQGAAVAAGLGVVRAVTRSRSARSRYAAACAALALMAALPVATFFVVRSDAARLDSVPAVATAPAPPAGDAISLAASPAQVSWERARLEPALPWLVVAWLLGVAALSVRFAGALVITRRIRLATREVAEEWQLSCDELARRLGVRRAVRLCESALAEVPSVVGWLRPVVLVPVGVFVGLDAYRIEAILTHELAHVRRHDYLVNLVQSAIETLLFYHPAVWWVSNVIREEREHCCDDLAVSTFGDVLTYATALADLEDLRGDAGTLALAATGGSLARRIERLLGRAPAPRRTPRSAAGLLAASLVAAALAGAGASATTTFGEQSSAPLRLSAEPLAPLATTAAPSLTPLAPALSVAPLVHHAPLALEAPPAPPEPAAQDEAAGENEFTPLGYASLSRDQLEAFQVHEVTPDFIRSLRALGYDRLSPDELVAFRVHGVDAGFVGSLTALGYARPSADDLVAMRVHGIDADFALDIEDLGLGRLPIDALVALRVQGVDASYVRELRDLGYDDLTWEDFVAGRVHGVSADFARRWSALGYARVSFDDLVAMRVHGVTTAFAQGVRELGYTPTIDQLIAMRVHGVSLDFVRSATGGGGRPSIDTILEMRDRGDR